MTKMTERVWLLLICRLYKSSLEIFFVPISAFGNGNECAKKDLATRKTGKRRRFVRTHGIIVLASKIMAAGI